jgi:hypothetical protein
VGYRRHLFDDIYTYTGVHCHVGIPIVMVRNG